MLSLFPPCNSISFIFLLLTNQTPTNFLTPLVMPLNHHQFDRTPISTSKWNVLALLSPVGIFHNFKRQKRVSYCDTTHLKSVERYNEHKMLSVNFFYYISYFVFIVLNCCSHMKILLNDINIPELDSIHKCYSKCNV